MYNDTLKRGNNGHLQDQPVTGGSKGNPGGRRKSEMSPRW